MKKLISLGLGSTLLISSVASAAVFDNSSPYIGLGYKYQYMKGHNDWNGVVPSKYDNGDIYVGVKFHENFGFELGYSASAKESDEKPFSPGNVAIGTTLSSGESATLRTKVRLQSVYFDINGFYAVHDKWNLLGSLGIAYTKARIEDNGSTGTPASVITDIQNASGKRKAVARVGLGAEYKHANWGFRGKLLWEGTSRLRVTDVSNTVPEKYFRNSYGIGLGVSYYF